MPMERTASVEDKVGNLRRLGRTPSRAEFETFDAEKRFDVETITVDESPLCIAGQILQGLKKPHNCTVFGSECTPEHPLGATMVSAEGACAAYYRYGRVTIGA